MCVSIILGAVIRLVRSENLLHMNIPREIGDITLIIIGSLLLICAKRIDRAIIESAKSSFERRVVSFRGGRGSTSFWAAFLVIIGIYNLWVDLSSQFN